MNLAQSRTAGHIAVGVVVLCFIVLFLPSLPVPLDRDEGEYAWSADLWARGDLPYRDSSLQEPPGTFLLYRLTSMIAGPGDVKIHALLLLNYILLILIAARIGRRWIGAGSGGAAAALLALSLVMPLYEPFSANTEAFLITCAAAGVYFLGRALEEPDRPVLLAASGLLFGLAAFFKQVAVTNALFLLPVILLAFKGKRRWMGLLIFTAAAALPYVIFYAYYTARGAGSSYFEWIVGHNLEYAGAGTEGGFFPLLLRRWRAFTLFDRLLWAAALAGLVRLIRLGKRLPAAVLGGWLLSSLAAIVVCRYFRGHYFLMALPALAILAGSWAGGRKWVSGLGAAILGAAWLASTPWLFGRSIQEQVQTRYGDVRFLNTAALGELLKRPGGGPLFILGSEPQIYHSSGRAAITPYVIMDPLFGGYTGCRARQAEVMAALTAEPPEEIVVSHRPGVPLFPSSDPWLYDQVLAFVRERYRPAYFCRQFDPGILRVSERLPSPADPVDFVVYTRRASK